LSHHHWTSLQPNHGQLEVIGKSTFDEATITKKWAPESGSHVIEWRKERKKIVFSFSFLFFFSPLC
jgi:hypothetical protein